MVLAQILTILLSYGTGHSLCPAECASRVFETTFETNVHVEACASIPDMSEISPLARHVNEAMQREAYELYSAFVQEMSIPQEELWEEDADDRTLRYDLNLIHSTPTLVSLYGSKYQYTGGAHGSVQYVTKTFAQQKNTICELSLDDLFLPGYRDWLFRHCEDYFKLHRCGYYSDDDWDWIGFCPQDLDAFLLTENGLLLLFQNYVISGYEDEPVTLLIPYDQLMPILNQETKEMIQRFMKTLKI